MISGFVSGSANGYPGARFHCPAEGGTCGMSSPKLLMLTLLPLCSMSCGRESGTDFRGKYVQAVAVLQVEMKHSPAWSLDISPDDREIAYAGSNIAIWNLAQGRERIIDPSAHGDVQTIKFSPDGRYLAYGGSAGVVTVAEVATGGHETSLEGDMGMIRSVDWSANGEMILASGNWGRVTVWDVSSEAIIGRFQGYKDYPSFRALFSSDDRLVYAGQGDGTIRAWDVGSGKEVWNVDAEGSVWEIALCENGKSLLSSHIDGSVILWDLRTKHEMQRMRLRGAWLRTGSVVGSMSITGDGQRVVLPSSIGYIELWDIKTWSMLECFKAHPGETTIWETSISHDGKWFASSAEDGTIRIWRLH